MKKILLILFIFVVSLFARTGGPDRYGYIWLDSDESGGPTYTWTNISYSSTKLDIGSGHLNSSMIELTRPFEFYNREFDYLLISRYGVISFGEYGELPTEPSSEFISRHEPNYIIAPLWMELEGISTYYYSDVFVRQDPDQVIIQWNQLTETGFTTEQYYFQAILNYTTMNITYHYYRIFNPYTHDAYIGIENGDGTGGLFVGTHNETSPIIRSYYSITFTRGGAGSESAPYYSDLAIDTDYTVPHLSGWQWGIPVEGPDLAHSESHCFGTDLRGNYDSNADWTFLTPDFNLVTTSAPMLDFYQWYDLEDAHDGGLVEITTDGGSSWRIIEPVGGYSGTLEYGPLSGIDAFTGSNTEWHKVKFDLSDYVGRVAQFRFRLISDSSGEDLGWYIDDISFYEQYGVIDGYCDLAYSSVDQGTRVTLVGLAKTVLTDRDGYFMFDSVNVWNNYTLLFEKEMYTPDSISAINVEAGDSLAFNMTLSLELYHNSFDLSNGGLVAIPADGGWEWGAPNPSVSPFSAHSDSFCWGTTLEGDYPDESNMKLDFSINLSMLEAPVIKFWQWYEFNGVYGNLAFDGGNVKVTNDHGETWNILYPDSRYDVVYNTYISPHNDSMPGEYCFGGDTTGNFWHHVVFDLSEYQSQEVTIRFEIESDNIANAKGWYIDDVLITDDFNAISEDISYLPEKIGIVTYPNPFNSTMNIEFSIAPDDYCQPYILIADLNGKIVDRILSDITPGPHSIHYAPNNNLPSGIYYILITNKHGVSSKKITYVK